MKAVVVPMMLGVAVGPVSMSLAPLPAAGQTAPSGSIRWQTSLEAALRQSRETGQPVLLSLGADWCPYCRRMDQETFTDGQVITLSQGFICVRADTTTSDGAALAQRYSVTGIPTVVFLDSAGAMLRRIEGFQTAAEFAEVMRGVLPARVQWRSSLADALRDARATGKPVLVAFDADWCPFSRRMEQETYTDSRVAALSRSFICVKVDVESDYGKTLCREYAVDAFPYLILFNPSGQIVQTHEGFCAAADLTDIMRRVASA
jgi:thiol:disulfide interchange protein